MRRLRKNAKWRQMFSENLRGLKPKSFALALAAGLKSRPDAISRSNDEFFRSL
jgi:hypothetical protein